MGLKDWFSGQKITYPERLTFGRYSDLYKTNDRKKYWDEALESFYNENFLKAYIHILNYLTDDTQDNIVIKNQENLEFSIIQGSKLIEGKVTETSLFAISKIVKCNEPHLGVFRKLLEENRKLEYAYYCLDPDNIICLKFHTRHIDANPYKIYYGLKELATHADYKDDYLSRIYEEFTNVETAPIIPQESHIVTAKYEYFKSELNLLNKTIQDNKFHSLEDLGAISFLVGAFVYKMDYLLLPEGRLMQLFEKTIHTLQSIQSNEMYGQLGQIQHLLHQFELFTEQEFSQELYYSSHTFGISSPVTKEVILNLIQSNMEHLKWAVSSKNPILSKAISTFVLGKIVYDHSVPAIDKNLIHLYFRVTEPLLFASCGFEGLVKNGKILRKKVLAELESIQESHPGFKYDKDKIMFDADTFAPSFLNLYLNASR